MTRFRQSKDNNPSEHPVTVRRLARKMSQEELARRAGVSRTLLSSVETNRATPSVTAAMAIAQSLDSTVEELFATSVKTAPPAWACPPKEIPCRYWEVRNPKGVLRYPVTTELAGGFAHDGVLFHDSDRPQPGRPPETLTLATCDPASSLLAGAYNRSTDFRLLAFPGNSRSNLKLLAQNKIHLGAIHCSTEENETRNLEMVREFLGPGWVLLRLAWWESGLALRDTCAPTPARRLGSRRWAMREAGSSARDLMERMVDASRVRGKTVRSHRAVAESIRSGWAEAGVCIRLCAEENRLHFRREQTEALDLVLAAHWLGDHRFRRLVELIQSRSYRATIADLPGYSSRETGTLFYS